MPYNIAIQNTASISSPSFCQDVIIEFYLIDVATFADDKSEVKAFIKKITAYKSEAKVFEYHHEAVEYLKKFFDYKYSEQHQRWGAFINNDFLCVI